MTKHANPTAIVTGDNCPTCGHPRPPEKSPIERLDELPLRAKYIRQKGLMPILPFSSATLWRRVNDGSFPKPVKVSTGVTGWVAQEVRAWLEANPSARRTPPVDNPSL